MTSEITCGIFGLHRNITGFLCLHFQPHGHGSIKIVQNFFTNAQQTGANQNDIRVFCDFVQQNMNVFHGLNSNNAEFHENLVIMYANRDSHLDDDAPAMLNEFIIRGMVLAIIAAETLDDQAWDLYCTSARTSGGGCMLLEDASRVLEDVISSVVNGEDTLREAFLHGNLENTPPVAAVHNYNMEEEGETTDNVQDIDFDHGLLY